MPMNIAVLLLLQSPLQSGKGRGKGEASHRLRSES